MQTVGGVSDSLVSRQQRMLLGLQLEMEQSDEDEPDVIRDTDDEADNLPGRRSMHVDLTRDGVPGMHVQQLLQIIDCFSCVQP